jgi:hypothetical protein
LNDITLDKNYTTLVGYTHEELVHNFDEYIENAAEELEYTKDEVLEDIKKWYNGYSWDAESSVYNPYSVLNFFSKPAFLPYWFNTGSPKFLIDLLKSGRYTNFDFNKTYVNASMLEGYEVEDLNILTLFFQTGYLTIKEFDRRNGAFILDYPNREVEQAMAHKILAMMTHNLMIDVPLLNLIKAFEENNIEKIMKILNVMLRDIPYNLLQADKEAFFHSLVHITFRYVGFNFESELQTSDGRMDVAVKTNQTIYIFEFKIDKTAQVAIEQIIDKRYAEKYKMFNKNIVGIGVNFDSENRRIGDWISREL